MKNGHIFEHFQTLSEGPAEKCDICGEKPVEKMVSASSFHLKGSGWYVTDYKNQAKTSPKTESNENKSLASEKSDQSSSTKSIETTKEVNKPKSETTNKTDSKKENAS